MSKKTVCGIVLVFLFYMIDKTIKHLIFKQHTFAQSAKPRYIIQRRIENPVKHLRWTILQK